MKRLEFKFQDQHVRLNLEQINLFFGPSSCGKSTLARVLEKALAGSDKTVSLDSQPISKNQFQVRLISANQNIVDELKLGSKSEFSKMFKRMLTDYLDLEQMQGLISQLDKTMENLESILQQQLAFLDQAYPDIFRGKFIFDDLFSLIKSHFVILNLDGLSDSVLREMLILSMIQSVEPQKESILLIDDMDEKIDSGQFMKLVEKMTDHKNLMCLLFLKNPEFIQLVMNQYPVFLMTKNFKKLDNYVNKKIINLMSSDLSYPVFIDQDIKMIRDSVNEFMIRELLSLLASSDYQILEKNRNNLCSDSETKWKFLKNLIS